MEKYSGLHVKLRPSIIFIFIGSNDGHQAELTGSQNQINAIISEGAERIGDKFKRKLRQTLNSMDQHSSGGMPAVQRARTSKGKRNLINNTML